MIEAQHRGGLDSWSARWASWCVLVLVAGLLASGCEAPVGPARVLEALGELPEVPPPDRLEEFDRNVQEGFEQRFARLEAVIAEAQSESEDAEDTESESTATAPGRAVHEVARALGDVGSFAFAYRVDETARAAFANARRLEPLEPRWPYFEGLVAARTGAGEEAEALLDRAVELDPLNDEVVLAWVEQRLAGDRTEGVEERLQSILDLEADHAVALYQLGGLLQRQGRTDEALPVLRRAHEADPDAGDVRYALAQLIRDLGEVEEAEELLRGVAVGDGASTVRSPRPWLERVQALQRGVRFLQRSGEAAYRAGRFRLALTRFSEAAELAPDNPLPQFNRLLLLLELDEVDEAVEQRERLRAMVPGHRQLLFLSALLEDLQGNQDAAIRDLRASIEADPGYASPRIELARWSFRSGDLEEGRAQFAAVLEREPENDAVRLQWMLAEGRYGEPRRGCALIPDPESGPLSARLAVGAARLLAAVADHCGQDVRWAVRIARSLYEQDRGVYNAETVAMALFGAGRAEAAIRVQSQIAEQLGNAQRSGTRTAELARVRDRLESYRGGRAPRSVWTDDELRELGFFGLSSHRRAAGQGPIPVGAAAAEEEVE